MTLYRTSNFKRCAQMCVICHKNPTKVTFHHPGALIVISNNSFKTHLSVSSPDNLSRTVLYATVSSCTTSLSTADAYCKCKSIQLDYQQPLFTHSGSINLPSKKKTVSNDRILPATTNHQSDARCVINFLRAIKNSPK